MLTEQQKNRYLRHILLKEIGAQGQQKLLDAKVLVVGAGGIGAPALQYLTSAGVGTIGIADDDVVDLSNLQRQVIYRDDDVGKLKVDCVEAAIHALNPDTAIIQIAERINDDNARTLFGDYDLVLEGVDNFETRFALNRAGIATQTPLISTAVGRFEGQLATFKPYENPGNLPCYRCLVPDAPPRDEQINCAEEGVLGAVTGVIGTLAALEAIKELTGIGESLAGRLMIYDGLSSNFRTIGLPADPTCVDCSKQ